MSIRRTIVRRMDLDTIIVGACALIILFVLGFFVFLLHGLLTFPVLHGVS